MFKHSIKWIKKNYGHGRSGPSTCLQLHLPHSFPSPRHSAVILSTKALVGPLSFTWLLDFFQALGLIFCVWDCLLKVWPVIWLKLNDIQEISGGRERERQTQQGLTKIIGLGNRQEKSGTRWMWRALSSTAWLDSPPLNNIFLFFQPHQWSRSYLQSLSKRGKAVPGKGCGRRIVLAF